jgi:predicted N-acyltransferase
LSKDTEEEQIFRQNYAQELQKKKLEELEDERKRVKQQGMRTPGRRGEEIKHEEIDKEIVRRYRLSQKKS